MAAASVVVTAAPLFSSPARPPRILRPGSSYLSISSLSSLLRLQPLSLSFSASHSPSSSPRKLAGGVVVACLPSTPARAATPRTKLFVSGLSFRTTEDSLRNAFETFGQLVEVNLVMDRIANRPRGFAFLRYATEEESKKAIEGMHGKFLDGRVIFVEVAKSKSELQRDLKQTPRQ